MANPNYYLIGSSAWFLIPSLFAYYRKLYGFSALGVTTVVISINYWRNPIPSLRKTMDLVWAKSCFFIVIYHGVLYVPVFPTYIIGYPLMGTTLWFYYLSNRYHHNNTYGDQWVLFHMMFHYCISIGFGMLLSYVTMVEN